jgi:hypothetical protein
MNLNTLRNRTALILGAMLLNQPLWSGSCDMEQIDQFLQRGFTHEQVVELCGNPQPATPSNEKNTASTQQSETETQSDTDIDKSAFYLQTVIDADKIEVTPDAITYWRDKCYAYGSEGFTGFRPEACVNMRTTIQRKGLKVVRAAKGIIMIRDQEMIVSGDIKQEVLNSEKLKPKALKAFTTDYPSSLTKTNIPVKKGIDPMDVAETLKRLALD